MQTRKLNVGFIGNGKSTNRYHIPFILRRKDKFNISMIYTMDHSKDIWAEIKGTIYTESLEELLNNKELDVIVVSTPSRFHAMYARKVVEAGHNCVVEKPFCETKSEAEELFALAKEKDVMLQCYQNRRFDADFLTVQKVIESGKLGDLLEIEMHFDYYRPELVESINSFSKIDSYLYGHACHTLDQVISYFGKPDKVHYDVRQLLGEGRFNDYFDLDLYYGVIKVSVKSSYFRIKERPSFVVYGKKGMFIHAKKDKQEEHLKMFYMPTNPDFGIEGPEDYGTITYYDDEGKYHEEKVETVHGDYARYYDALYETLVNGAPQLVTHEQTLLQLEMLEEGIKLCK